MKVGDKVEFTRTSMFYGAEKVNGEVIEVDENNKYKKILVRYKYWRHYYNQEMWFSKNELTVLTPPHQGV